MSIAFNSDPRSLLKFVLISGLPSLNLLTGA